jgi:hypothetical protein
MRIDDLWYNVFAIEPARSFTSIRAVVFVQSNSNATASLSPECRGYESYLAYNWTCQTVMIVGTEDRIVVTPDKHVTVEYIGDLAASQSLRDFTSKYLLVPEARVLPPSQRTTHPQVIV